jgi:protein-disulfide isomerase
MGFGHDAGMISLCARVAACTALIAFAGPGLAQEAAPPLSPQQRQAIEVLIGDYIRNNPEVILEAVRNLQVREQAEQAQRREEALTVRRDDIERDATSPVVGNASGDVTVVEFFDYRCGYCKAVVPSIQRLLKDDPKVRLVMKEFPILSPESRTAARLALAVWRLEPKRYFDVHTKLMEAKGDLTEARIFDIARSAGVNMERARREMENPDVQRALDQNMQLAQALGVNGTPGFIIGKQLVPGAIDLDTLKKMVAEARQGS